MTHGWISACEYESASAAGNAARALGSMEIIACSVSPASRYSISWWPAGLTQRSKSSHVLHAAMDARSSCLTFGGDRAISRIAGAKYRGRTRRPASVESHSSFTVGFQTIAICRWMKPLRFAFRRRLIHSSAVAGGNMPIHLPFTKTRAPLKRCSIARPLIGWNSGMAWMNSSTTPVLENCVIQAVDARFFTTPTE